MLKSVLALAVLAGAVSRRLYYNDEIIDIPDNLEEYAVATIEVVTRQPTVVNDLDVELGIDHPDLSELEAWLESPRGNWTCWTTPNA